MKASFLAIAHLLVQTAPYSVAILFSLASKACS